MKAIALISGGLDSILAAKIIKDLGIDVIGLNFLVPFSIRNKIQEESQKRNLQKLSGQANISIKTILLKDEFLSIVRSPKHGHGKRMNPCIDCRIMMLRKAKEIMQQEGASFLITGEVVAQRPMSQHRRTMEMIDRLSGVEGINIRPLSAKILPVTIPEEKGWIDRDKLFDLNGRGRRQQLDMAVMSGIVEFPQPAGGCLLTDPNFATRLKDLIKFGSYDLNNVELLKVGRHFRLSNETRLVVGRNEEENFRIEELAQNSDYLFLPPEDIAGPVALLRAKMPEGLLDLAAGILCRYCDCNGKTEIPVTYFCLPERQKQEIIASALSEEELGKLRI
jgi:tRNA U34 2-thiouridine synthase MnmA/TrmU